MKYDKSKKIMIASWDWDKYNAYECKEHGFNGKRKDVDDKKCFFPSCKNTLIPISDIKELQIKFKKELNLE